MKGRSSCLPGALGPSGAGSGPSRDRGQPLSAFGDGWTRSSGGSSGLASVAGDGGIPTGVDKDTPLESVAPDTTPLSVGGRCRWEISAPGPGLEGPIGPGRRHPLTAPDRCPRPTAAAIDGRRRSGPTTAGRRSQADRPMPADHRASDRGLRHEPWPMESDPPAASRCAWLPAWRGSSSPRPARRRRRSTTGRCRNGSRAPSPALQTFDVPARPIRPRAAPSRSSVSTTSGSPAPTGGRARSATRARCRRCSSGQGRRQGRGCREGQGDHTGEARWRHQVEVQQAALPGQEPLLVPQPGHQPGRLLVPVLALSGPGQRGVPLGLRGSEQRLPDGPRLRQVLPALSGLPERAPP